MKPIRIFRHEDWVQPGRLTEYLDARAVPWELVCIDCGDEVPQQLDDVSGLAFLGGTMSVNDPLPWLDQEMGLVRKAADQNVPLLGHCLGSQLIAKALGATVIPMADKEIGWFEVDHCDNAVARDWLRGVPDPVEVFIWHHDAFTLPPGATPLYSSAYYPEQAYACGNIVATVAHPEVTVSLLEDWIRIYGDDIAPVGPSIQPVEQIAAHVPERCAAMHRQLTDRLYDAWLKRFPA